MQTDLESQRGRQSEVISTGRGGAGNQIRSPSRGVDPEVIPGSERGRETSTQRDLSGDRAVRSGRGGAGNIRSPSRDPANRIAEDQETSIQERLIAEQRGRQADAPFSTGRGGAGNFSRDKSRSRSAVRGNGDASPARTGTPGKEGAAAVPATHHSGGRGGWGNVREEKESVDLEKEAAAHRYEAGLAARYHADHANQVHSSGKGGAGNMTSRTLSPEEFARLNLEEQDTFKRLQEKATSNYSSGGRGGAGNYHSKDREQHLTADGERGRDSNKGGIFDKLRSISRAKGSNGDHRPKD